MSAEVQRLGSPRDVTKDGVVEVERPGSRGHVTGDGGAAAGPLALLASSAELERPGSRGHVTGDGGAATGPLALLASSAELERLGSRGYFIRDGFVGAQAALGTARLAETTQLTPAGVRRSRELDSAVRGDVTAWLDDSPLHAAFEALREHLNRTAYLGLARFDVQLARYENGAAYARHRDAFGGSSGISNRRVTAIVYLNEAWRPEHGGQLRLHVEPAVVDVEPLLDRLVVFLSEQVEHEVLPVHAPRLAATAWFYGP
jgi:SM-20-related protein